MEATIVYWVYIGDNGKSNGNYRDYRGYRVLGFRILSLGFRV